jgi:hypothetical protein
MRVRFPSTAPTQTPGQAQCALEGVPPLRRLAPPACPARARSALRAAAPSAHAGSPRSSGHRVSRMPQVMQCSPGRPAPSRAMIQMSRKLDRRSRPPFGPTKTRLSAPVLRSASYASAALARSPEGRRPPADRTAIWAHPRTARRHSSAPATGPLGPSSDPSRCHRDAAPPTHDLSGRSSDQADCAAQVRTAVMTTCATSLG